jgi:hypothetical protein
MNEKQKQMDINHTQEGITTATSMRGRARANKRMGSGGERRKHMTQNKNLIVGIVRLIEKLLNACASMSLSSC